MELTFRRNNPLNTTLVGRGVTYNITTNVYGKSTDIERSGAVVGKIVKKFMQGATVKIGSRDMDSRAFLRASGFSVWRRYQLAVAYGSEYKWRVRPGGRKFTLEHNGTTIARFKRGLFSESTLHVNSEAIPILDDIVVSVVLLWAAKTSEPSYAIGVGVLLELDGGGGGDDGGGE